MRFKKFFKLILFVLISFVVFLSQVYASNDISITSLVVTSSAFKKVNIYVPKFKNEDKVAKNFTQLLRRALNYHLFVLATPFKPISFDANTYEVSGSLEKNKNFVIVKAELSQPAFNSILKKYKVRGPSKYPYLIAYYLCDKIIKEISGYQGIAFSKVAFIKRTRIGDKLYITDFIKAHPKSLDHSKFLLFPKFSLEGDKIAYLIYTPRGYTLRIFDLKTLKKLNFSISGLCSTPVWAPGGNSLFLTLSKHGKISIYKFDLKSKKLKLILTGHGVYQASSVSRDGKYLAYVYDLGVNKPKVYVINLKTGKHFRISIKGYDTCPRFSPKGDILAYISKRHNGNFLVFVNLKNMKYTKIKLRLNIKYFCFSPTGDYILASGRGPQGRGIYLLHLDSGLSFLYLPGGEFLYPTWSRL